MKKILVFSILFISAGRVFSQSLDDVNNMMDKQKYAAAKVAIDKYLADPKNAASSDGYYYKARVYNSLSRDSATSKADAYSYKVASFDALQKSQQYDNSKLKDVRLQAEGYKSYLDIYLGLYDIGAQQFNNKDFSGAYNSFNKAQQVEDFILAHNYTYKEVQLAKTDTSLLVNLAITAFQLKDTAAAVRNYRKLTDAGVVGKDYRDTYEFLANYYSDKNDDANLRAILAKGKAAYPDDKYWNELEMDRLTKSGDKNAMFAKYEELYRQNPNDFANSYNYGAELFNSIYGKTATNTDPAAKEKLTEVLKSAMVNDPGVDAVTLMTNHLFNDAAAYSSAAALVKGSKPEDIKKKKDLMAQSNAKLDETLPYADKALKYYADQPTLTSRQKVDYRTVAETLSDIYAAKGNQKKSDEYDKIKESIKFN